MNKPLAILWYELRNIALAKGYLVLLFFPLIICLAVLGVQGALHARALSRASDTQSDRSSVAPGLDPLSLVEAPEDERPQGYVDQAGLIHLFPEGFKPDALRAYLDETAARNDLRAGKIRAYFVIPKNFLQSMPVLGYSLENTASMKLQDDSDLNSLIRYNLANGDEETLSIIRYPILSLKEEDLSPQEDRTTVDPDRFNHDTSFMLPVFIAYGLWGIMIFPTMLMATALNRERDTRSFEVLLTSASTDQVLLGKFAGLGLAGLLIIISWVAAGILYLHFGQVSLPGGQPIPPAALGWIALYTLGSFLFLGMLVGTIGALAPNSKDSSSVTTFLWMPGLAPFFLFQVLLDQPNGPLAVSLTFIPFTALGTVVLRLMAAPRVPLWQLILGLTLLLVCSLLVIKLAARLLRAQLLLTGWSLSRLRFLSRQEPAQKP